MINPNHRVVRPALGGLARKMGSTALAAALSLSMIPSIAFAEGDVAAEGGEPTEQTAPEGRELTGQTAAAEAPSAPTATPQDEVQPETEGQEPAGSTSTAQPAAKATVNLVEGKVYTAPIALVKDDGSPSGAARYFDTDATIEKSGESYTIIITATAEGRPLISSIEGARSMGEGRYALTAPSLENDITVSFTISAPGMPRPMTQSCLMKIDTDNITENQPEQPSVDKTALQEALGAAKAVQKGQKTDEAWKALQDAIAQAEAALANERIPQTGIDGVTAMLNKAVADFNSSSNAANPANPSTPEPERPGDSGDGKPGAAEEGAVETPGGFKLVKDKAYDVTASTTSAMINQFGLLSKEATVAWNGTAYVVTIGFQGNAASALKSFTYQGKAAESLGGNRYRFETADITKPMTLAFSLGSPAPEMTVEGDVTLDTTSLPTASGEPIKPEQKPESNSNQNNAQNNSNSNGNDQPAAKAAKFQVGHTYRVPIKFTKENGTETSMAAKYFGDTAIVRPKSDGTFDVTFAATSEGLKYITSLKYQGKNLSRSGDQFTVNIPAAERDTTVPIEMDITMLKSMGINDPVTSDMHLYLSRAEDLGTNAGSTKASSSPMLAQTGDENGVAGLATLAALAAGGMAVAVRRRKELTD